MAKLQQIRRSNGTLSHSVNIPGEVIEELGWEKGDELDLEAEENTIKIRKREDENDTTI